MSKLIAAAKYLEGIAPSRDYQEYERHKKALQSIVDPASDLWIEVIKELTDRMFV